MDNYLEHLIDLPAHMRDGMILWIEHGIMPGSFLQAVLENDLIDASILADDQNLKRLRDFSIYLLNCAPHGCYGSKEKVAAWKNSRGLKNV